MAWPWRPAARRPGPDPAVQTPTRPAPALHPPCTGAPGGRRLLLSTPHTTPAGTRPVKARAPGQASDPTPAPHALAALPGQTGNEVWAPLGQTGNEGPGRKGGRSLAAVGSGDPGLHGAHGLGLSWAPGLVPTPAEVGGGRQGPPTGPSVLGTQLWLSTPAGTLTDTHSYADGADMRTPHAWPMHRSSPHAGPCRGDPGASTPRPRGRRTAHGAHGDARSACT